MLLSKFKLRYIREGAKNIPKGGQEIYLKDLEKGGKGTRPEKNFAVRGQITHFQGFNHPTQFVCTFSH